MTSKLLLSYVFFVQLSSLIYAQKSQFVCPTEWIADSVQVPLVQYKTKPPTFKGGNVALQQFIKKHTKYPERAFKEGLAGTVYVEVYVQADGVLQIISAEGAVGGGCKQEALRLVSLMPPWEPALRESMPVRCRLKIPITFSLL